MQDSLRGAPKVRGIGLVLYDERGQIFIVAEGIAKPLYDKKVGDLSIPWETMEMGADGKLESIATALERVLTEEVGFEVLISPPILLLEFMLNGEIPQEIYFAECQGARRFGGTAIETGELLGWEWAYSEDIRNYRVRGGMKEILDAWDRHVGLQRQDWRYDAKSF
ncbi:MAG: NUDIX hydrolase [Candidatus Moranbacteria bacterium]|jgi:hypothetical protein|nr:NUDIX hydrolase [Candidatus Moranbacteria bacterium]MDQ5961131.1 hypothetical protein [Patescibacteria group bacterium]